MVQFEGDNATASECSESAGNRAARRSFVSLLKQVNREIRAMADDRDRDTEHTTIIERNGGGGGGGGVLAVVLLVIVVLVLLFVFRDQLGFGAADDTDIQVPDEINVNVQ
jgi:hypothetical protein